MDFARLRTDLLALGLLAGSLFMGLSLASYDPADPPARHVFPARTDAMNLAGPTGAAFAHDLIQICGVGAYVLLAAVILFDLRLFSRSADHDFALKGIGLALTLVAACTVIQLFVPVSPHGSIYGSGGWLGAMTIALLKPHLTFPGILILLTAVLTAGLILTGELQLLWRIVKLCLLPITIWSAFGRRSAELANSVESPLGEVANSTTELPIVPPPLPRFPRSIPLVDDSFSGSLVNHSQPANNSDDDWLMPLTPIVVKAPPPLPVTPPAALQPTKPALPVRVPKAAAARTPIRVNPPMGNPVDAPAAPLPPREHSLPELAMLEDGEAFPYEELAKRAQINAIALEKAFKQFGLNVKVVEIDTGPVITQFELELEAGLRLSKITALADDLAIALRVPSVRVVAPIPGKNTVGVEVPNDIRVMVRLKELIQACPKDFDDKRLPLYLGKDVSGKPLVVDLAKMPHVLIAGRTGTGKSVCLNTLILSILMTRSPDQVKMLMIDPKMVELSPYTKIPHLMHPVITDMKKAEAVLGWAVDKMEERYDLLARVGVRHLDSYNKMGKAAVLQRLGLDPDSEEADLVPESMPYIVIIADEMADMIMTSGKDVEGHIIRLAQKSRAIGIHLVLATQKPTVDVITGLIKSNLPARISFQVASRVDSRVVLDEMGAEKLLGNGDMLYLTPGTSSLVRAQGTYVSDDEVNRLIAFFSDRAPEYDQELIQLKAASKEGKGKEGAGNPERDKDDLYEQACEVIIREGRGSVSLLQRNLGVGYGRGSRMIDWMAEDGIVGDYNGSQAREVLVTMEEWEELRAATTN